jgi:hypothetical protein
MSKKKTKKTAEAMSAEVFDKKFDEGSEDILEHFDADTTVVRVLVDFPKWMLDILDSEAKYLGVPRQAIIKTWLNERIRDRATIKSAAG